MGEYADELVDYYSNPDPFRGRRRRQVETWDYADPNSVTWTTAEGVTMRLDEMTISHRTNAMRVLERRAGRTTPTSRAMRAVGVLEA